MAMYKKTPDIIIRNGTIVDGTGAPAYYADIAIVGDKIDYIGDLKGVSAPVEIDAHHKYVTPGFIDGHSHADFTFWAEPDCGNHVTQGITTTVVGNCGYSGRNYVAHLPADPKGKEIKCVYDYSNMKEAPKGSMAAVLDRVDAMGLTVNTAWFCGHNDLRVLADVHTVEATEEQFQIMAAFLREAMDAGFIGFSTGLEFDPGVMSKPEEVERLAMIAGEYDANYASHMRDEGTYILEAVNEALEDAGLEIDDIDAFWFGSVYESNGTSLSSIIKPDFKPVDAKRLGKPVFVDQEFPAPAIGIPSCVFTYSAKCE